MVPTNEAKTCETEEKVLIEENTEVNLPKPREKFVSPRWALLVSALSAINIVICLLYTAAQAFVILTNSPYGAVGSGVYGCLFYLAEGIYGLRAMVVNNKNSANTLNILALFGVLGSAFGLAVHIVALSLQPCRYEDYPNSQDYYNLCFPRFLQWHYSNTALIVFDGIAMATNSVISLIILGHQGLWDPAWDLLVRVVTKALEVLKDLCSFLGSRIQYTQFDGPKVNVDICGQILCYANFVIGFVTVIIQIVRDAQIYSPSQEVFACFSTGIWTGFLYVATAVAYIKAQRLTNDTKWWTRASLLSGLSFFGSILLIIFSGLDENYYRTSALKVVLIVFGSLALLPNGLLFFITKRKRTTIPASTQNENNVN